MGFESALFWWGVAVSPILFTLTLIALHWASRDLLSKDAVYFIVFIVGFQLGVATCFKPARPDHHSLLALLFVLMAGYCFRLTMRPFNRFQCWMAGLTAALAVWVSIESMVMVVLMVTILSLFWVWQKGDFLQKSFHFCAALCLFVFAALLLERPLSDIATAEYDRISIVMEL